MLSECRQSTRFWNRSTVMGLKNLCSSPSCFEGKKALHHQTTPHVLSSRRLASDPPTAPGARGDPRWQLVSIRVFRQDAFGPNWELRWRPDKKEVLKTLERQVATLAALKKKEKKKKEVHLSPSFPTPTLPPPHTCKSPADRSLGSRRLCATGTRFTRPSPPFHVWPPPPACWINIPSRLKKTHPSVSLNRLLKRDFPLTAACQAKIPHHLPAICQFYQPIDFSGAPGWKKTFVSADGTALEITSFSSYGTQQRLLDSWRVLWPAARTSAERLLIDNIFIHNAKHRGQKHYIHLCNIDVNAVLCYVPDYIQMSVWNIVRQVASWQFN